MMRARYTDLTATGRHFTLQDNTHISFPLDFNGRRNSAGDFIKFTEEQALIMVKFVESLQRPDRFEPCYVDIPEELLHV